MGRFGSVTLRALRFGALAQAVPASGPAPAQDNANLPGGATSPRETHGDWIVACGLWNAGGKSSKICAR
ncbi:MAG: hypothetical protein M9932_00305 [Xanthobacteraceae bacterium]|nr:hypothetical protein [Xanthobacteraceae bacterium]